MWWWGVVGFGCEVGVCVGGCGVVAWLTRVVLAALLIGIAVKLRLTDLVMH